MRTYFPFSAIVGQSEMKLALLIAAVDPSIGGVMVFGDRGTGKSTAVRARRTVAADEGRRGVPVQLRSRQATGVPLLHCQGRPP